MTIGPPRVLFTQDQDGNRLEPIEEAVIDVDEAFSRVVVEKLSMRKGDDDRDEAVRPRQDALGFFHSSARTRWGINRNF